MKVTNRDSTFVVHKNKSRTQIYLLYNIYTYGNMCVMEEERLGEIRAWEHA